MKQISIIIAASLFAATGLVADAAEKECLKQAAIDGRNAMQKCKAKKSPAKESCEKQVNASLAGAGKACKPAR